MNPNKLWDKFACYTYLPLLAGPEVLQETIAWGVSRGLFAYCLGKPKGYAFDTIYFEQRVHPEQCVIGEHSWLLDAEVARKLLAPPAHEPEPDNTDGDEEKETDGGDKPVLPPPILQHQYAGIRVETLLDQSNWRQFFNSVIQPLVQAGAKLQLNLLLEAVHEDGLDPDLIELRIRESIMQLDRKASVETWDKE